MLIDNKHTMKERFFSQSKDFADLFVDRTSCLEPLAVVTSFPVMT